MKVCILTHTFPRFEGDIAAPFMESLVNAIVAAGNEVFVLAPYSKEYKKDFREKKYQLITYKYIFPDFLHKIGYSQTLKNDMELKPLMLFLSPLMFFFGFWALLGLIKKEKIEVVNAHWILPNGFIAALVSLFTGVPVISTLPGSDVYLARKNFIYKNMALFAAKISKVVTSNSLELINDLVKLGVNRDKCQVIIYGVDVDKFKPKNVDFLRKKFFIPKEKIIVLSVGRLVAKKGFLYLIEAAANITKNFKEIVFFIVGEGDQREELQHKISEKSLDKFFIMPGWVNYQDLSEYYNLGDIFVLPSIRDEKGNLDDQSVALVEAMACGRPVVTSNFPGYRVVVEDEKNGFLVSEKDVSGIVDVLKCLLNSKTLRQKIGKEARSSVLNYFSWEKIADQYLNLFQDIRSDGDYSKSVSIILNENDRIKKGKQILAVLTDYLGETKNLSCLDVGCSSGVISNLLAGSFNKVVGIDTDKTALNLAENKFKNENLEFKEMSGEKIDFKDNNFDVVICHQVYNFVDNPQKLMSEIYRVLKKGGICFFSARNKFALVEPQYHLPLLSWFPKNITKAYFSIFNPGKKYFGENYMSYFELIKLTDAFEVHDYTLNILKHPVKFGFNQYKKYAFIAKLLPNFFLPLLPNFIWILEKK